MGFSIIPTGQDKRPIIQWKEYQVRRATLQELTIWNQNGHNFAAITGSISDNLVILDCDDPHVSKLLDINTLTVRTPSGGIHLYIRSMVIPEKQQAYRGYALDIQADKAYALLPGSKTDKGEYVIINDTEIKSFDNIIEYLDKKLISVSDNREGDIQNFKKKVGMDIITRWVNFEGYGGHNYKQCKCPFHGDTDPSFTVYDSGYYCFGCGEHGDIISFVMKIEGLDFKEAINKISEITGVKTPELKKISASDVVKTDSNKYFSDKGRFIVKILGDEILEKYHFISMSDNPDELYIYENGVYNRENALNIIRVYATNVLDKRVTKSHIEAVIYYIQTQSLTARHRINNYSNKINLKNGIFNLKTWALEPHTPDYLSTQQIPVNYDQKAKCPNIDKFLLEILPGEDIALILQLFGYSMIPNRDIQKAFMLTGDGSNGKGTLIRLLEAFIGGENCSNVSLQKLNEDKFSVANLFGKLLNICGDLPDKRIDDDTMFKAITGKDTIEGERKYEMGFRFKPVTRLVFSANEIPKHMKNDYAYFRRWIIINFLMKFEGKKDDKDLDIKLQTPQELSGLLNYALYALDWLLETKEYYYSKTPDQVGEEYLLKSDPLEMFIKECTTPTDDYVNKTLLYDFYCEWAKLKNIKKILPSNQFGKQMKYKGFNEIRPYENEEFKPRSFDGICLNLDVVNKLKQENLPGCVAGTRQEPGKNFVDIGFSTKNDTNLPGSPGILQPSIDVLISQFRNGNEAKNKEKQFVALNPANPANMEKTQENITTQQGKSVTELDNNLCGICGNPINGQDHRKVGNGLGEVHVKCEYEPIKIKALVNTNFVSINTHAPIEIKKDEISEVPGIQAISLITKKMAERVN